MKVHLSKELRNQQKELLQKIKEIKHNAVEENIKAKLPCVIEVLMKNEDVCETLISLPIDEYKILMNEIISSDDFRMLLDDKLACEEIEKCRCRKKEKAEKRKNTIKSASGSGTANSNKSTGVVETVNNSGAIKPVGAVSAVSAGGANAAAQAVLAAKGVAGENVSRM